MPSGGPILADPVPQVGGRISVVIPHLNRPDLLDRCLASLKAGQRQPDEIFVVDNGSRILPTAVLAAYAGATLLEEPFFSLQPPKSSGRELFRAEWFGRHLEASWDPQSVQATLLEVTAETICRSVESVLPTASRLIVCGGGSRNETLMRRLRDRLAPKAVEASEAHGLPGDQVEAAAFAWLAQCAVEGRPGNLPEVTGAKGRRVLGAIYPA